MKNLLLFYLLFLSIGEIYAQQAPDASTPSSNAKAKVMTTLTNFTPQKDVMYFNDVVYGHQSDMDLHLQILKPQDFSGKKMPCIIYIQGSAWFKQNCYMGVPKFGDFSKRGYVMALVEYRSSTTAKFPAQLQDVKSAVRFVRKNADKFGVDTTNIFIWGDSSGGNMSLLETLTQDQPSLDTDEYGKTALNVNACVAYYPVTDIIKLRDWAVKGMDHQSPNSPEGVLFGKIPIKENAAKVQTASPIIYISKEKAGKTAPILIMTGNNDHVLPFMQSVELADKLEECGYKYKFYKVEGGDHGSWQFWTKESFDIVDNFFKANMK